MQCCHGRGLAADLFTIILFITRTEPRAERGLQCTTPPSLAAPSVETCSAGFYVRSADEPARYCFFTKLLSSSWRNKLLSLGGGYGAVFRLLQFWRADFTLQLLQPLYCSFFLKTLLFSPCLRRGRRWTRAQSPVSWLLCIQQQLCVNAWTHGACCSVRDIFLGSVQPSRRLSPTWSGGLKSRKNQRID